LLLLRYASRHFVRDNETISTKGTPRFYPEPVFPRSRERESSLSLFLSPSLVRARARIPYPRVKFAAAVRFNPGMKDSHGENLDERSISTPARGAAQARESVIHKHTRYIYMERRNRSRARKTARAGNVCSMQIRHTDRTPSVSYAMGGGRGIRAACCGADIFRINSDNSETAAAAAATSDTLDSHEAATAKDRRAPKFLRRGGRKKKKGFRLLNFVPRHPLSRFRSEARVRISGR